MRLNMRPKIVGQAPLSSIEFAVPKPARDAFFAQLKRYAGENGFTVSIAPIHPVKEQFGVDMWRKDVFMSGANIFEDTKFDLGIYAQTGAAVDATATAHMAEAIKSAVLVVPGVMAKITK